MSRQIGPSFPRNFWHAAGPVGPGSFVTGRDKYFLRLDMPHLLVM